MTGARTRPAILIAGLLLGLLAVTLQGVQGDELEVPSEDQCRPYIEKALKDLGTEGSQEHVDTADTENDEGPADESAADVNENDEESGSREKRDVSVEEAGDGDDKSAENENEVEVEGETEQDDGSDDETADDAETAAESKEDDEQTKEADGSDEKGEDEQETAEAGETDEGKASEEEEAVVEEEEEAETEEQKEEGSEADKSGEEEAEEAKSGEAEEGEGAKSGEAEGTEEAKSGEEAEEAAAEESKEGEEAAEGESGEDKGAESEEGEEEKKEETEEKQDESEEGEEEKKEEESVEEATVVAEEAKEDEAGKSGEEEEEKAEGGSAEEEGQSKEAVAEGEGESKEDKASGEGDSKEDEASGDGESKEEETSGDGDSKEEETSGDGESAEDEESSPEEEELIMEIEIPEILRPRDHINQLLKLDEENEEREKATEKVADVVLRDLKRLYDNAIKPLETLYKYRDLSNRHFGDPEIFSKPLVLFMGPWSGGKSSIINYLLDIEYQPTSLRTGAEPSPAYFNIVMHGEEEEVLDGTQLAADWTFSGLQKFGQGLLDRLKGFKLNNKLLEKVNIVEIPGILEIRKQVQRLFPFNDACQWFIDRADIIFLVYDPSKLDVGPETEAILDQLKGREYQTRMILNKADQVKPEELMRVQGALIWNISPLMSSAEPPIMYSTSLWSIPYEAGAPTRLLYAQERAFLRDLRSAIDKRVEHKIASARRFAVRVRNHAKMVDCYLTTYYNQKSFFAKKKDISDRIIENPQDYHIYEGLSTLTNISRYDLPDPDVYRDFFRLNPLYDFPLLSSTCTYFRGCPINRLDVAIAYDLPELVGKYKKSVDAVLHQDPPVQPPAAAAPASAQAASVEAPASQGKARSGASRISLS